MSVDCLKFCGIRCLLRNCLIKKGFIIFVIVVLIKKINVKDSNFLYGFI